MPSPGSSVRLAALLSVALGPVLAAQDVSGHRLGPMTVSGEVSGSMSPEDTAFFNDTGYDVYPLRMLALTASASVRLGGRASILAEVVSENLDTLRLRGAYLRVQPFGGRPFHVQAGRIPPVFGAYARRAYGSKNPLIGLPLGYQYLTTLRADAAADSADALLRVRGRGWLVRLPVGNPAIAPGIPLASSRYWDTGVEARLGHDRLWIGVAVTQGTLASPRLGDDNGGKQVSARIGSTPRTGLILGVSAARGEYASQALMTALPRDQASRTLRQVALGADAEYSWGPWLLRAEGLYSRFDLPAIREPLIGSPVGALALSVEGVRRLVPGLYAAARVDHLGFSQVVGAARGAGWDAPVSRVEAGLGFQPWRAVTVKVVGQRNWRNEGYVGRHTLVAIQAMARF